VIVNTPALCSGGPGLILDAKIGFTKISFPLSLLLCVRRKMEEVMSVIRMFFEGVFGRS
jgi:hypothetical protein